jgi:hypothetical protein
MRRNEKNPFPGLFEVPEDGKLELNAWATKAGK